MPYTTINKSTDHFNTVTYSGTGSAQSITGVGFRPDWVWIKVRSQAHNHYLYDVVRGSQEKLSSNTNGAEIDMGSTGLTAFNSDGFSIGNDTDENASGQTYASWNWLAGGSQGSSNTDGAINTTYTSANTTAGFSISKYSGTGSSTNIGHGLGARPDLVFTKRLDTTSNWVVMSVGSADSSPYQTISSNDANLGLNLSRQVSGSESVGDNRLSTNSSSTIYNIGTDAAINASGGTYIAYCFRSITGYSKFGSYTGNGSTDGPFIFTGFRPAFVMTKKTSGTGDWMIRDNKRFGYNGKWGDLYANTTGAEGVSDSNTQSDLLSNGFKLRMSHTNHNEAGGSYIYMAFAEAPLVGSNNVPATAR